MKTKIAAVLSAAALFLSGCMGNVQLKDRAIVQEVGIDYSDQEYTITLQIFNPEGSSGNGSFDPTAGNNLVVEATGDTITKAFQNAADQLGKEPFLGVNRLIVVGMDTAKEGVDHMIDYFNNYYGSRATAYVVAAEGNASEIVSAQIKVGILPASAIISMAEEKERTGVAQIGTVFRIISASRTQGQDIMIPVLTTREGPTGEVTPEMVGSGILVDSKLQGVLDLAQTEGIQWAKGEIRQTALTVETQELGRIAVAVHHSSSRTDCSLEGETPKYTIQIRAACSLDEVSSKQAALQRGDLSRVEESVEKQIRRQVEEALEVSIQQYGADLLGLGRYLYQQYPEYWEEVEDNWAEKLQDASIQVDVEVVIDRLSPMANTDIV